jgi:DNA polymerase-3 subunit delta
MTAMTERALKTAITRRVFDPVYYIHGDDDFRKEDALSHLLAAAVDPAMRDFNTEVRRGAELDAAALDALLSTPPMLADRRAVVIRDVTALKKDPRATLDRYLAHPAPDTMLVLVAPAGAKADKPLADHATSIDIAQLSGERLGDWIARRAESLGTTITPEASALLQSAVGADSGQLAAELDKLASYVAGTSEGLSDDADAAIDEDAVSEIVGITRGETLGDLLDRVAVADIPGALALVDHVLAQPKVTGVSVVMALATQTLAIAYGVASRARGTPAGRLSSEFFSLLKETGAFPGRPWGEAVNAWVRGTDHWTEPALDRALTVLLNADRSLKDTRVSTDEQLISGVILTMCAA